MSSTIRIALVAEGVTDYEVLNAAIESMLNGQSFDMKLLQPEGSVAFTGAGSAGALGGGWKGVYKWCLQAVCGAVAACETIHSFSRTIYLSFILMPMLHAKTLRITQ